MKIAIINGPNLNLLGRREIDVYGKLSFEEYFTKLQERYPDVVFEYAQSNVEGELINLVQQYGKNNTPIIINPGGYSHTSVAIADTIAAINSVVVEVHISNIHAREEFRHHSITGSKANVVVTGAGLQSYDLAIRYLKDLVGG